MVIAQPWTELKEWKQCWPWSCFDNQKPTLRETERGAWEHTRSCIRNSHSEIIHNHERCWRKMRPSPKQPWINRNGMFFSNAVKNRTELQFLSELKSQVLMLPVGPSQPLRITSAQRSSAGNMRLKGQLWVQQMKTWENQNSWETPVEQIPSYVLIKTTKSAFAEKTRKAGKWQEW